MAELPWHEIPSYYSTEVELIQVSTEEALSVGAAQMHMELNRDEHCIVLMHEDGRGLSFITIAHKNSLHLMEKHGRVFYPGRRECNDMRMGRRVKAFRTRYPELAELGKYLATSAQPRLVRPKVP